MKIKEVTSTVQEIRMVWVGRDLWRSSSSNALPWAGTSFTQSGCSKTHPSWPWTLPM